MESRYLLWSDGEGHTYVVSLYNIPEIKRLAELVEASEEASNQWYEAVDNLDYYLSKNAYKIEGGTLTFADPMYDGKRIL